MDEISRADIIEDEYNSKKQRNFYLAILAALLEEYQFFYKLHDSE